MRQKHVIGFIPAIVALLVFISGLYAQQTFEITSVLRPGDPAPVPPELVLASSPSLNDKGQVAFSGDGAVFLVSEGNQVIIAGFGDPAPDDGTFISAASPSLNNLGQVAFFGSVSPSSRSGIFLFSEEGISPIVRLGDPAPGGGTFTFANFPSLNDRGQVAFYGQTSAPSGSGIFLFSDGTITPVARTGDPAPGGGTFISTFFPPSLNAKGHIAFIGIASPPFRSGIFLLSDGTITQIVRTGDPAPEGGTFTNFTSVSLNAEGQIAFIGTASPPSGSGIFLLSGGTITPIARTGDPAPEGGTFTNFISLSLDAEGQIAFTGRLSNQVGGVYLFSGKSISRIAGQGDPVDRDPRFYSASLPSLNAKGNVTFLGSMFPGGSGIFDEAFTSIVHAGDQAPGGGAFISGGTSSLNESRQVAFFGGLSTGSTGVFLVSEGKMTKIARPGDPAPGGGTFTFADLPSLNAQGQIAFPAGLSTGNIGAFLFSDGKLSKIARPGDPAPGGRTFTFADFPSLNDRGQAVFIGDTLPSPFRFGVFLFSEGKITRLVQEGDPAPGGGTFSSFLSSLSLNNMGQVAFTASLSTGGTGVFLFSNGSISKIARPGDPAPGAGTFTLASFPSLNVQGQVAFQASLSTGGSGVFLFSEGSINKVVRPGDLALSGGTFTSAGSPSLNASGQVAFVGSLSTGGSGIFLATPSEDGQEYQQAAQLDQTDFTVESWMDLSDIITTDRYWFLKEWDTYDQRLDGPRRMSSAADPICAKSDY